jgi:hypothetical protein
VRLEDGLKGYEVFDVDLSRIPQRTDVFRVLGFGREQGYERRSDEMHECGGHDDERDMRYKTMGTSSEV